MLRKIRCTVKVWVLHLIKHSNIEAILTEVCVLLFDEEFEGKYVQKLYEVGSEQVFLVTIYHDDRILLLRSLQFLELLLKLCVRHLKGCAEFIGLPEECHTCHLVDLRREQSDILVEFSAPV